MLLLRTLLFLVLSISVVGIPISPTTPDIFRRVHWPWSRKNVAEHAPAAHSNNPPPNNVPGPDDEKRLNGVWSCKSSEQFPNPRAQALIYMNIEGGAITAINSNLGKAGLELNAIYIVNVVTYTRVKKPEVSRLPLFESLMSYP